MCAVDSERWETGRGLWDNPCAQAQGFTPVRTSAILAADAMKRHTAFRIGWIIVSVVMLLAMLIFTVLPLLYAS